ncbi:MAG: hypothetical protein V8S34_05530 [Lawsonibacter sp.]
MGREDTAMELQPSLTVSQKLTLTPAMRQALRCLQLPIPELSELLQEEALSNPLLNAEPRSTPPGRPCPPPRSGRAASGGWAAKGTRRRTAPTTSPGWPRSRPFRSTSTSSWARTG